MWMMNWKWFGRNQSWTYFKVGYYAGIRLEGLVKNTKTFIIVGIRAETGYPDWSFRGFFSPSRRMPRLEQAYNIFFNKVL
jgi:hypothetical protein